MRNFMIVMWCLYILYIAYPVEYTMHVTSQITFLCDLHSIVSLDTIIMLVDVIITSVDVIQV